MNFLETVCNILGKVSGEELYLTCVNSLKDMWFLGVGIGKVFIYLVRSNPIIKVNILFLFLSYPISLLTFFMVSNRSQIIAL